MTDASGAASSTPSIEIDGFPLDEYGWPRIVSYGVDANGKRTWTIGNTDLEKYSQGTPTRGSSDPMYLAVKDSGSGSSDGDDGNGIHIGVIIAICAGVLAVIIIAELIVPMIANKNASLLFSLKFHQT